MTTRYPSAAVSPAPLAQPLDFPYAGRSASNRFMKAAMTERLSSWDPKALEKRGVPSPELINVYRRWGEGGIGLILTGNFMLEYDQLEAPGNAVIPTDYPIQEGEERFAAFKKLASEAKKHGSLIVAQVSHPGRQASSHIQPNPLSASDVQLEGVVMGETFAKPHAASQAEIDRVVESFAHAAEFLYKAGYDGIQLHGAHGYLLSQFLSPTTNLRTDSYGGSLENRTRIITDIAAAIRARTPKSFILAIKLNSVEFQDKGFAPEEARQLCAILSEDHFSFVELSGGTYQQLAFEHKRESTKKREAFFLEFAEAIVPALKGSDTRTYITGGLKTVPAMVDSLKVVDGVGLGRPITQEPRIVKDILEGKTMSAVEQQFDQNNFGLTNIVAGTQIGQMGRDQEPFDGSKPENKEAFMRDMATWMESMKNDKAGAKSGYVDTASIAALPYGAIPAKM